MRTLYVYILTNRSGTLYTGVTSNLGAHILAHKRGESNFTSRYKIDRLVYYEECEGPIASITREKQVKAWTGKKRIDLINSLNPTLLDLADDWFTPSELQSDGQSIVRAQG